MRIRKGKSRDEEMGTLLVLIFLYLIHSLVDGSMGSGLRVVFGFLT